MEVKNWFAVDGDNTLALDWGLNENSLVWEIGGFEGRWAQQIWDKFHCHIDVFEPQYWAVEKLKKRFDGIEKITIHPYGLMVPPREYEWETMSIGGYETDGAGLYSDKYPILAVPFRDINYELSELSKKVDLALMNIEGYEFELIPHLIETGKMKKFKHFWCQFHMGLGITDVNTRKDWIFSALSKTHDMIWNCFPTAVAWRLKE